MRTYIISDIHGDKKRFMEMLELINFSNKDVLYILGDVIDRGKFGIEILEYIIDNPNILLIKGNHEQMMEDSYHSNKQRIDQNKEVFNIWRMNGGRPTYKTLMFRRGNEFRAKIYRFLRDLPLFYDNVIVNNKTYYLVHGSPMTRTVEAYNKIVREVEEEHRIKLPSYEDFILWERVVPGEKYFKDKTVIFGHTPTLTYQGCLPYRIWHGEYAIGIDCGCGHKDSEDIRLACLCLDTMEEFYV